MKALRLVPLLLVLAACERESVVDIDLPDHEPQLSVASYFNPDSTWWLRLSGSAGMEEEGPLPYVPDATVEVFQDGALLSRLTRQAAEEWNLRDAGAFYRAADGSRPVPGRAYTVRVAAPGYDPVEATDRVPEPVPVLASSFLDSVSVRSEGDGSQQVVGEYRITFSDPPDRRNYYHLAIYKILVDYDAQGRVVAEYRHAEGPRVDVNVDLKQNVISDPGGFAGGALDDPFPFHHQLVFDDVTFDGQEYELVIRVVTRQVDEPPVPLSGKHLIVFSTTSEALYQHERTRILQETVQNNPFAEPVLVSGNVDGGFGIFAGYHIVHTDSVLIQE